MQEGDIFNKRVESIEALLKDTYKNLDKIRTILESLGKEVKRDEYRSVEGIIGTYDGYHLVDASGNKHEIPTNYAAKSRLVYGDSIKMIEDNGQTVFKQIQKVERKKTEGVLSKKEGKWYILTDSGSYRISDVAADFNQAQLNDEAVAFIPAQNLNAPFATLDKVLKKANDFVKHSVPQQHDQKPTGSTSYVVKPVAKPVKPVEQANAAAVTPKVQKLEKPEQKPVVKPAVEPKRTQKPKVEAKPVQADATTVTIAQEKPNVEDDDLR